jgi:hypothetical protein
MIKSLFSTHLFKIFRQTSIASDNDNVSGSGHGEAKPLDRHVVINFPLQNLS